MLSQSEYCAYPLRCPLCKSSDFKIVRDDNAPNDGSVAISRVLEQCCVCEGEWTTIYQWAETGHTMPGANTHGFMIQGYEIIKPGNKG